MNPMLAHTISNGASAHIYASFNERNQIRLKRIGTHAEVLHQYNQMVCLLGAVVLEKLQPFGSATVHSRSAPPGTWVNYSTGNPIGTPGELFSLAASPATDGSEQVGHTTWHGQWPLGMTTLVSGFKSMAKSTSEVSQILYGYEFKASVSVGNSHDVSAAKRAREAIARAKKLGYAIYEEDALLRFVDALETARFLHFFHQVIID